jgi:DNA-directed RNA polymerase subunit M/transcription elongation factor TFIIS
MTPTPQESADPVCPKCGSTEVLYRHHESSWGVPECDYKLCDACNHQWDHE